MSLLYVKFTTLVRSVLCISAQACLTFNLFSGLIETNTDEHSWKQSKVKKKDFTQLVLFNVQVVSAKKEQNSNQVCWHKIYCQGGYLQFGLSMNSNEGVLISVANFEVSTPITPDLDLLPSAPVSFFLARNDVTVGTTGHASVQGHIQVPDGKERVHVVIKSPSMPQHKRPRKRHIRLLLCFVSASYNANKPYQSSLLKTMKPRLPRPKATWLLWLSHQLDWGCPLTTLRKMTMFLKGRCYHVEITMYIIFMFFFLCMPKMGLPGSRFLRTHLIWRHLCSHTHPSPQVPSGLMGTDLVDPSPWLGGPIQSFWSYRTLMKEFNQN